MITFKQFLSERAENMRSYRKVFKNNKDALVGFEVEVFIPRDHEIAQDGESGKGEPRGITSIRWFDTLAEFEHYFDITRASMRDIDDDYENWLERQREQYIQDRLSDENTVQDLKLEFESEQDQKYSWGDWFGDEYSTAYDFVTNYDLQPRYGWGSEDGRNSTVFTEPEEELRSNWKDDIGNLVADRLGRRYLKGKKVEHGAAGMGDHSTFMVVPDSSISAESGERAGFGVEIVTPPLPAQEALDCLTRIFDFIDDEDFKTNSSTGLHVNISIPKIERLDPAKLVLMMGDEHILKQFNRVGNSMAKPQMRHVRALVTTAVKTGKAPSSSSELGKLLKDITNTVMKTNKFNSVNFEKLEHGYLEFRSPGNTNYHKDVTAVELLVGRWVQAMDIACNPDEEKTLYLKRLAKVFSENHLATATSSDLSLKDLLAKFFAPGYLNPLYAFADPSSKQKFAKAFSNMAQMPFDAEPSARQIKEMKLLMRQVGVTASDIIAVTSENLVRVEGFLKAFKLT